VRWTGAADAGRDDHASGRSGKALAPFSRVRLFIP